MKQKKEPAQQMLKPLIVIKTGTLTSRDWKLLNENGYLAIEHPNPEEFKVVHGFAATGNDITQSALYAIAQSGYQSDKSSFFNELYKRIYEPKKP